MTLKITKSQFQHLLKKNPDSRRQQGPRSSYVCDVEINNNGCTRHYLGVLRVDLIAMIEGRMHRGSFDIAPARKRSRRQRRADEGQRVAMMGALTAVMLVGCVTAGVGTTYSPNFRTPM